MSKYMRLSTPISVGTCYPQGSNYVSWYKVLSIGENTALLCRPKDGWTMIAHNPALYDTPQGQQLMWDYSTDGSFCEGNRDKPLGVVS